MLEVAESTVHGPRTALDGKGAGCGTPGGDPFRAGPRRLGIHGRPGRYGRCQRWRPDPSSDRVLLPARGLRTGAVIAEAGAHPAVAHLLYVSSYLPDVGQSQAVEAFMMSTSAAGWEAIDSTYIVCGQDRSTSVELQRFHANRATRSVELPTGHHPFFTRPDLIVEQVQTLMNGVAPLE